MKKLLWAALLTLTIASGAFGASESPLSASTKASIKETLADAVKSKEITPQQYAKALSWVDVTPCKGVNKSLEQRGKVSLANAIKKQLKVESVDVLATFKSEGWTIVYVDTHVSDEPYLFYSKDPTLASKPVTRWSGAATMFETSEIEKWVVDNAHGIPKRLAACFAWHVTLSRD